MAVSIPYVTAEKALAVIQSGNRVFVQGASQTPTYLLKHLSLQKDRLSNVEIVSILLSGEIYIDQPEYKDNFHLNSMFVSAPLRQAVRDGRADYIPVFLSEIPSLFTNGILPLDVAIVQVSEPDKHGFCSLGTGVDISYTAVHSARYVIAQVNPNVPRTYGDGMVHLSKFHALVECNDPLIEAVFGGESLSGIDEKIGCHIAELIPDRGVLQMGIGDIPDAVLKNLHGHKDLAMHTEMCSDGVIDLCEKGVITNKYKKEYQGRSVVGFAFGSRRLYDYIDENPSFCFLDIAYVNDTSVIRKIDNMITINSAVEIDVTGQVCADSIGSYQYSGVGGQMDFMRGAALSKGGKPIIALTSRTSSGISRIVPYLKQGAGVVTTRAHVHYFVTEYGVAYMYGKNLRQRAKELINIAHPDDREALEKACFDRFKEF